MIDEDYAIECMDFSVRTLHVGLDVALQTARADYIHGRVEIEEFEVEIDRLLRKRAAV